MLIGVVASSNSGIVTNGLTLHLDAGQLRSYPGSGTTWTDLSGNADNGTLVNGPTFNSANGGSIVFDAIDDYVISSSTTNTNVTSTTGFTFGVWVYPEFTSNDFNTQIQAIICSRASSANNFDYWVALGLASGSFGCTANSRNLFYTYQGNNAFTCSNGTNVWTNNAWNYIVSTHSGTTLNQYVNGSVVTSNKSTFTANSNTNAKYIFGHGCAFNQTRFRGKIAINQVYNRVLTATEVLQNYNAQKSRFGL